MEGEEGKERKKLIFAKRVAAHPNSLKTSIAFEKSGGKWGREKEMEASRSEHLSRLLERDRRNRWDGIGAGPNNRWLIGNGISQGRSSRYRARWFVECLASYLSEMATGGQLCKSLLGEREGY